MPLDTHLGGTEDEETDEWHEGIEQDKGETETLEEEEKDKASNLFLTRVGTNLIGHSPSVTPRGMGRPRTRTGVKPSVTAPMPPKKGMRSDRSSTDLMAPPLSLPF